MNYQGSLHVTPRWLICGAQGPSEEYPCRLFASNTLTMAELQYRATFQEFSYYDPIPPLFTHKELFLTTWFRDFVVIDGKSWEHCFGALFKQWNPAGPTFEQIGPERREIEP